MFKVFSRKLGYTLLATSALVSVSSAALAQVEAPSSVPTTHPNGDANQRLDAEPTSGEIIVTAQKRSERLRDVPLSITAVGQAELAARGVVSVADLEKIVPGFTYRQSSYGSPVFSIRGVGFYDEQVAIGPTVSTYVDQVPLPYSRMTEGASLDLERVEVLKGPQGTLFGINSTGGAINYIAARPTERFASGFGGSYARFNEIALDGYLSGPVAENLKLRLSARSQNRDGWQIARTRFANQSRSETYGQIHFAVARLLADWTPSDRLTVIFNVNGWTDTSDNLAGQARNANYPVVPYPGQTAAIRNIVRQYQSYNYYTGDDPRVVDFTPGQSYRRDDRFFQASARIDYQVATDLRLVSITTYNDLRTFTPVDVDGLPVNASTNAISGRIKSFAQELRLDATLGPAKLVLGGNYQNDRTREHVAFDFHGTNASAGGLDINTAGINNFQSIRDLAVFGGIDIPLTSTIALQASARYTDERRAFRGCLTGGDESIGPNPYYRVLPVLTGIPMRGGDACVTIRADFTAGEVSDSLNQSNFAWRTGLTWKPSTDVMLYANVSRGFKAGGFGTLPAIAAGSLRPVTQESVTAYEVGAKLALFDRAIDVSAAAFHYDYRDKQLQGYYVDPIFGNLPTLVNIAKSRVNGAEINISTRPFAGLRVSAGVTYVDSKVTGDAFVGSPFLSTINAKGEPFPATPKWQGQVDLEYRFGVGNAETFVGSDLSFRSKTYSQFGSLTGPAGSADVFLIKAYTLVGLRAGLEFNNRYRIQIFGKNVTDQHYWQNVTHQYDTVLRYYGLPVTYGVSVSV